MVNIYAVTAESAVAWLLGAVNDPGLCRDRAEVAYLNELIGRDSYPEFLRQCVALADAGCSAAMAHVVHPGMERRYLTKHGGVITRHEEIIWHGEPRRAVRIAIPPPGWVAYVARARALLGLAVGRTDQKALAVSGVANSR